METRGSRLSKTKPEYVKCKVIDSMLKVGTKMRLDTRNIPKSDRFKYIGSITRGSRDIDDDITHHAGAA